jgi:hypothetical protein
MTDWSGALARAFQKHLEVGGSGGSPGSHWRSGKSSNALPDRDSGTSPFDPVVLDVSETHSPASAAALRTTATTVHSAMVPGHATQHRQSSAEPDTSDTTGTTESAQPSTDDLFEERAALIEEGTGVPRSWAEGFARLNQAACPPDVDPEAWRQLIDDAGCFLDRWGSEADRMGWSALDVFGVSRVVPHTGYDAVGLVLLIRGGEVIAIGSDRATIRTCEGKCLTYLRRTRAGTVAVWDLVDSSPWTAIEGAERG